MVTNNRETWQSELRETIEQMKTVQKAISTNGQPPSDFELNQLKNLGKRYSEIVEILTRSNQE